MSTTGQGSILSFAPQPQAYYDNEYFPEQLSWNKIKTQRMAVGINQGVQALQPETGGVLVTTGVYKDGYFFGGDFDISPRAEGSFGWLLLAALGAVETTPNLPAAGMNRHIFKFSADQISLPWMSFRRFVPGRTRNGAARNFGEIGRDCLVGGMRLAIPNKGLISASVDLIGLDAKTEQNPTWTYSNQFEDSGTIPMSGYGEVRIGGRDFKMVGMEFAFQNNLSNPDEETVVGKFNPDDLTLKARSAMIRAVVKWDNGDLLSQVNNGGADNTDWSPMPFTIDKEGTAAFEAKFYSGLEAVAGHPYCLKIRGSKIVWQAGKVLETRGGTLITQEFIGQLVEPKAGDEYIEIELENKTAGYVITAAPLLELTGDAVFSVSAGAAVNVVSTASLTAGVANLNGGRVRFATTYNGESTDELSFGAGVTNTAGSLSIGGTVIGTVDTVLNGAGGKDLLISLNVDATPALVEQLIEAVTFDNPDAAILRYNRRVLVTVHDGVGGVTNYEATIAVVN
jgi:hypothetical protein